MGSHRILSSKTNVLAYLDYDRSYDRNTVIVLATGDDLKISTNGLYYNSGEIVQSIVIQES